MEWTRDKTLSLINEYRTRRGLWDMTHDDYRKKDVKQKLLLEVSASLGGDIPILEVEKKFHTLRTQYHREINRMKRKEPYNSKWFGFKNLQFLSSPKACRSSKGRVRSEITEEGTVTTKLIMRDTHQMDTSGGSSSANNDTTEEFLTITRKPISNVCYETVTNSTVSSRSHALEKLIEETTKDVDDIEEPKPKLTIKEITVPVEISTNGQESLHIQHQIEEEIEDIETMDLHSTDNEITYQTSSGHTQNSGIQSHPIPTRIIKVQRRDTCNEDEYYEDSQHPIQHHIQTAKRIYYGNGHQAATNILHSTSASATPSVNSVAITSTAMKPHRSTTTHQHGAGKVERDEYTTYGEYVANEMRGIENREILIALKHKINTALFEANMAELQK